MILNFLVFLVHAYSINALRCLIVYSKLFLSIILNMSRFLKFNITSSTKAVSCLLFYRIDNLEVLMISSVIVIVIVREV